MHPNLQIDLREWIIEKMPETGAALERRVLMPSGMYMTTDEVAMHMASAAMAVLEVSCSACGLDGE